MALTKECKQEMEHLLTLVERQKQYRTGVVFPSRMNNYFYDAGTGKILRLQDEEYRLLILKLLSLLGYDCSRVDIAPFRKGKKGSQKLSIALAVIYAAVSWVTLSRDNILAELIAIILNGITVIQVLIALYQKSDLSKTLLNFIV